MENLLTGLECLVTFDVTTQRKIIENIRSYAGAEVAIDWLLQADYEDPKEFLGVCVWFDYVPEDKDFWEDLYNSI